MSNHYKNYNELPFYQPYGSMVSESVLQTLEEYYHNKLKNIKVDFMKKYEMNKFYVGSDSIFGRNWGHPTLTKAIIHAKALLENENKDEIFIVQIVKVVKKQSAPVEIIAVK